MQTGYYTSLEVYVDKENFGNYFLQNLRRNGGERNWSIISWQEGVVDFWNRLNESMFPAARDFACSQRVFE